MKTDYQGMGKRKRPADDGQLTHKISLPIGDFVQTEGHTVKPLESSRLFDKGGRLLSPIHPVAMASVWLR